MGKRSGSGLRAIAVAALLAAAPLVNAAQEKGPEAAFLATLRDRVEVAYQDQDVAGIEAARQELLAAAGAPGASRAAYYAAYARFRQGLLAADDGEKARDYVDACIGELQPFVQSNPADAEARALLGSCFGISTRYHRLGMATRGLEARRQMAAARELAPRNPWVVLQDGLADYATPRLFGGDRKLAIEKLERSTALFAVAMKEGSRLAAWGAAEAWLQLGQMYRESGRADDARMALETSRSLAPRRGQQLASL